MSALDLRFADHLRASRRLAEGAGVVVGVSGGLDSMTLLYLMRFRDGRPRAQLQAAHIDHRMRAGSGGDAAWVGEICAGWGVPLHLHEPAQPVATEAEGRRIRYRFFEEVRAGLGEGAVTMTAHTADDQAETVLFRAARGSGPRGLSGIRTERPPSVVRPLLPFRRSEIEAFAAERGIPFRDDPTNRDPRWTRNRLRHEILPVLEEAVPGAIAALAHLAGTSHMQAAALDELLDERIDALAHQVWDAPPAGFELDREALCALSAPVLTLVVRRAVQRLGGDVGRAATAALIRFVRESPSGRRVAVSGDVEVEHQLGVVRIRKRSLGEPDGPVPERSRLLVTPGRGQGVAIGGGWVAEVVWAPRRPGGSPHVAYFSESDVRFPLTVRSWEAGDRMRMPYGWKKVKKLLLEARVAADLREGLLVVADALGAIVWVPGVVDPTPRAGADRDTSPGCWMAVGLDHQPPGR